jgi:hypothetical protein
MSPKTRLPLVMSFEECLPGDLLSDYLQEEQEGDHFEGIGEGMDPMVIHREVKDGIHQHGR